MIFTLLLRPFVAAVVPKLFAMYAETIYSTSKGMRRYTMGLWRESGQTPRTSSIVLVNN